MSETAKVSGVNKSSAKKTLSLESQKAPEVKEAPKKKVQAKSDFTESVVRSLPQDAEMIMVETTGQFGLIDPITGIDISYKGSTKVPKDSPFIVTMLKRKRIKEV